MIRAAYGPDEVYTRMAHAALPQWKALSDETALPLFHPHGVLFFFQENVEYAEASIDVHRRLGLPLEVVDRTGLETRYPQVDWSGVEFALFEAGFGALMARRGVQTVVDRFVERGGSYEIGLALTPAAGSTRPEVRSSSGERFVGEQVVYACGPWLGKLFPEVVGGRIFPTRQACAFFSVPSGDARFSPDHLPGWADWNDGDIFYGFPDLEARGFKVAFDQHGEAFDPDTGDRQIREGEVVRLREYLAKRFPQLADQPIVESRVCQYENTSDGHFLIDRHPELDGVWLLGGGSGHGYKHGPEVGRMMAERLCGVTTSLPERFRLASKGTTKNRAVH